MGRKKARRLLCPEPKGGLKFVYLVGTDDGHIKIGLTTFPRYRIESHHRQYGVKWVHFFAPSDFGHVVEYRSKCNLEKIGERFGKTEVYRGIDKEDAIRVVREVTEEHRAYLREMAINRAAERAWEEFRAQYVADLEVS